MYSMHVNIKKELFDSNINLKVTCRAKLIMIIIENIFSGYGPYYTV